MQQYLGELKAEQALLQAIHEAHVVEILVIAQSELGQSGGRSAADAVAEEWAAAVAGGAAATTGGVEGAAVAAPEAAGPKRG